LDNRLPTSPTGWLIELGHFDIPQIASHRRVRAYLPARRPKRATPRPVLVLFDGQNVFDDEGSFAGAWHAHLAVDRYAARRANPPVVIAVDHGHHARLDELAPFRDGHRGGGGDALARWIAETLLPRARGALDLSADPALTVIGGSSLGGLAALYAHLRHPGVFGGALCMSPSLWFGRAAMVELAARVELPRTSKVYLDVGGRESRHGMISTATQMARLLTARGYDTDRLMFKIEASGRHHERAWRRRLPGALRFLFG
jgi:predicted alpha/beta superfamily hydrolase